MRENRYAYRVLTGKPKGKSNKMSFNQDTTVYSMKVRDHVEDLGIDGRIKLQWILKKWDEGQAWTGMIRCRTGTRGRFLRTQY